MGINTVLNYRSPELMATRKLASDIKNNTEELTFITPKKQKIDYVSRKAIDGIMDNRILAELNDDFAHCKDIH